MPKIVTRWHKFEKLSADKLYELLRFRQGIFVVELIPTPLRIGRVAVAAEQRQHGLGRTLMEEALLFCRAHYPGSPVVLTAQVYLVLFYRSFGFEPTGAPFDDFGVAHVDMCLPRTP